ncbi:MAG: flavodoxin family protein [Spirochaetes bacterium]|nr:MAG: flavodoxin family protein [Spirochaetota bacterium]
MSGYKVVVINGSPRKKRTQSLLLGLKDLLEKEDFQVEIVNLSDYEIKTCRGCEVCITKGSCVIKDDMNILKEKMINSDGLVLATPVYMRHVSGSLKNFIDRTCSWFHRPELTGKVLLPVVTTAGSALKQTLHYLGEVAYQWGMVSVRGIGRKVSNIHVDLKKKEYIDLVETIRRGSRNHKPSLEALMSYQVQRVLAEKILTIDRDFWRKKGWDRQIYYYSCRIGVVKRLLASLLYTILLNRIRSVENEDL